MKSLHNQLAPAYLKDQPKDHKVLAGMVKPSTYNQSHTTSLSDTTINTIKKKRLYLYITTAMMMGIFSTDAIASTSECPTGYIAADLSPSDYAQLSAGDGGTINVNGTSSAIAALGLQLKIDMTQVGSQSRYISSYTSNGKTGFTIVQNLNNHSESNTVSFDFNKPVNKLSFTLYDIDVRYNKWRDKITVKGKNGNTSVPLQFSNSGNNMSTNNTTGIVESYGPDWNRECYAPNSPYNYSGANDDFTQKCAATVTFENPITQFSLVYDNTINSSPSGQNIEMQFNKFCVKKDKLEIEKDDGKTEVNTGSITNYIIKVKNSSSNVITGAKLSDPVVSGLIKQSGIQCDSSTPSNACNNSQTLPSITDLESTAGYSLPDLAAGQTYAIIVPAKVTAGSGNITNTATVTYNSKTITDTDTNTVKSSTATPSTEPGSCPAGHQMYYVGANPPAGSIHKPLTWTDGQTERTFTFSDGKKLTIKFPFLIETKNEATRVPPYYGDYGQAWGAQYPNFPIRSKNAINVYHESEGRKHNHTIDVFVSPPIPISQTGFIIQDIDSERQNGTDARYIERVDVSDSGGQLTYEPTLQERNAEKNIVTAKKAYGQNTYDCDLGECSVNATWSNSPAGKHFILKHWNMSTITSGTGHNAGYSDFYFCLAPPKITLKKQLTGQRVYDNDEFKIDITDNQNSGAFVDGFTTEGEGDQFNDGKDTSAFITLKANQPYTVSETIINESQVSAISNYDASYSCINTTKTTNNVIAEGNGHSFTLPNLNYTDDIVCTITNTPKVYNFSGTVFNDNGNISDSDADPEKLGGVYNNDKYFNGQLDEGEKGIYESGLKVSLTDCNNNILRTVDVSSSGSNIGKYAISLPKSELNGATQVCLVEHTGDDLSENLQTYSIDTSPNSITIPLDTNPEQLEYPNKNFGNVIEKNTALVLVKRQYFHDCNKSMPEIQSAEIDPSGGPTAGFSKDTIKNDQGEASSIGIKQCISYRIDAYNRGFVDLTQVVIKDTLPEKSILTTPLPHSPEGITFSDSSVAENQNGQVITNPFTLPKRTNTNNLTRKAIFFNTNFL